MTRTIKRWPLFLTLLCLAGSNAVAQVVLLPDWRGERHMNCLQRVASDPSAGMALADDWLQHGGSLAARHCMAVAEAAIGDPGAAAKAFAELAATLPEDRWGDIGQLWAQSGNAWLLAEEPEKALAAFDEAVKELPTDPATLTDRAVTRALLKDYAGAAGDLTRAIQYGGPSAELLLYRGTAYRYLGDYDSALADLDAAVDLEPSFPEVYLERGRVRAIRGDVAGAASDWRQVQRLAPNSALAEQAEGDLRKLGAE